MRLSTGALAKRHTGRLGWFDNSRLLDRQRCSEYRTMSPKIIHPDVQTGEVALNTAIIGFIVE